MIKTITEAVVDGYLSGETDFLVRLGQADVEVEEAFETAIMQPLLAVLSSPDQAAVLTITGHADREDTEGLTREQRRQQEFEASDARAISAAEGVQQKIRDRFGGPLPADFDQVQQLAILDRPAGA